MGKEMEQRACYGCLPAKIDFRDYKVCSANANVEYPEEFSIDNLPRIKDQKQVNSCCAHATSTILEYHADNNYKLSTNFIYGIQKKLFNQTSMGMYLRDACEISRTIGDMLEDDCKGNNEIPTCYSIAEEALANSTKKRRASAFKIDSYYLCQSDNDIKFALMNYGPVLCAINWRNNFKIVDDVVIFDTTSAGGGHAVVCVGWNKKGWIIQNSWGTGFAEDGRFILPFETGFVEARAIVDKENDSEISNLVLTKPVNNKILDVCYRFCNFVANAFKNILGK